jgi:hypothetical protein
MLALGVAVSLAVLAAAPPVAGAADEEPKASLEVTAIVALTGGRISGTRQLGVTLRIDHLTPRDEVWRVVEAIGAAGQGALRAALQGRSDGLVRLGALDSPLNLAVAKRTEKGRSFVLVSSRALRVSGVDLEAESSDYPFGVVAFTIDDLGLGEGLVYPAARISIDGAGAVVIENFQEEPGVLKEVRVRR